MPVYTPNHVQHMQIWRTMHSESADDKVERSLVRVRQGPSSYVAGLTTLTLDDILRLRSSQAALQWFSVISGDPSKIDLDTVTEAFAAYRFEVDQAIARRLNDSSGDEHSTALELRRVWIRRSTSAAQQAVLGATISFADLSTSGLAGALKVGLDVTRTLCGRGPGETLAQKQKAQAQNAMRREMDRQFDAIEKLKRGENPDRLSSKDSFVDGIGRDTLVAVAKTRPRPFRLVISVAVRLADEHLEMWHAPSELVHFQAGSLGGWITEDQAWLGSGTRRTTTWTTTAGSRGVTTRWRWPISTRCR